MQFVDITAEKKNEPKQYTNYYADYVYKQQRVNRLVHPQQNITNISSEIHH